MIRRTDDGILDAYARPDRDVRLDVLAWWPVEKVRDQYIERRPDLRMVWTYVRRLGPMVVARKVRSRLQETGRNRKVAAVGIGRVTAGQPDAGRLMVFFACNHPPSPRRVVVDRRFARPWEPPAAPSRGGPEAEFPAAVLLSDALVAHVGWSPYSGLEPDVARLQEALQSVGRAFHDAGTPLPSAAPDAAPVQERRNVTERGGRGAVLFGLGNYAKTHILPHWPREVPVICVHEIDPHQLQTAASWSVALDTSPVTRDDEDYDAWLIAGFHHTHAPLACHALERGRAAVVEKPICTTADQLQLLRDVLTRDPTGTARLFACFHKRYSQLNATVHQDLGVRPGDPIDYHCIVYEIPLPDRHWYRWPNSGSRLLSNGCHWIDHFMFLNGYPEPTDSAVWRGPGGAVSASASLANGATFTMVLTDVGSERIGVQDYIELRAADAVVRLRDSARYEAERTDGRIRRRRANPMEAYSRMYREIGRRVHAGLDGDGLGTLRSAELVLRMEAQLVKWSAATVTP